jgi:Mg2+ and Co2+ transporter CorA
MFKSTNPSFDTLAHFSTFFILYPMKKILGELFRFLTVDVNDLYDDIDDLRECLQGLFDLRLNVSSFQMNRVMRLLALLPATVGGLLGMNITDGA